jgi:hypothetical protein
LGRKGRKLYFWGRGKENFFKKKSIKREFLLSKRKGEKRKLLPFGMGEKPCPLY